MNMHKLRTLFKTGFLLFTICIMLIGCGTAAKEAAQSGEKQKAHHLETTTAQGPDWTKMQPVGQMNLLYADQFSVDYYENDYALITIGDQDQMQYLVIPKGQPVPENLDTAIVCVQKGCSQIYMASSTVMDFFRELDALDHIGMTSTKSSDWSIPEVKELIENEKILYVGKYSAPDYELLTCEGAELAVENTMIYHSPETAEKLELLGIPVIVERSSYETKPFGRMEWIRLWGVLLGEEERAEAFFADQMEKISALPGAETGTQTEPEVKTAFFYVSSNGMMIVRKNRDYVAEMIRMAGGTYVPLSAGEESDNALSTMNMQMEQFYAEVVDADILIYNSTIEGELENIDELISKNAMFAEFKAVKEGNVYCTGKNMFQQPTAMGEMLTEMYAVIHNQDTSALIFMKKLQ